jgi:hypothetical protein
LDLRLLQKFGPEAAKAIVEQQILARKYHAIIEYFVRHKDQIISGKRKAKGVVSPATEEKIDNCLFNYQVQEMVDAQPNQNVEKVMEDKEAGFPKGKLFLNTLQSAFQAAPPRTVQDLHKSAGC